MLPYSPLHHLLLSGYGGQALVMTSGNVSDEPIAYRDDDASTRLADIADLLLVHDRPIQTRTDDSVVRVVAAGERLSTVVLRRSRGYVPASLPLPDAADRPILACGAELKNTFCVARGSRAWVGHHIGDLENYDTLTSFTEGIEHFQRLFAVAPEVVAHDLHPEYLATKYALELEGVETIGVQHHHAHLAAALAEHGAPGAAVGAIFDGTGYGPDGTVWGGEFLCGDLAGYARVGALLPVRLPGGAQAIRQPWRMACSWLVASDASPPPALHGRVDGDTWQHVTKLAQTGLASPVTTSAATASNRRPMLVVTGDANPVWASLVTCRQASPSTRPCSAGGAEASAATSHAHAIRHGWRIARAPPGSRTGKSAPTRSKPSRSPHRSSPPQTVPSGP